MHNKLIKNRSKYTHMNTFAYSNLNTTDSYSLLKAVAHEVKLCGAKRRSECLNEQEPTELNIEPAVKKL